MNNRTFKEAFFRDKRAVIGAVGVLLVVIVGLLAPLIAPFPKGYTAETLLPPSAEHLLGTDKLGLDIFAEIVWGAQTSIYVSLLAVAVSALIGIPLGLISGYFRGRVGALIDSLIEIFLTMPKLALMIVAAAILGSSITNVAVIIGLLAWPPLARVCRNSTLKVAELPYIEAARCSGVSTFSILFKHVLINIIGTVMVNLTLVMADSVLQEASLSFLGLGDPNIWSWGMMLKKAWDAGAVLSTPNPWWWWLFPSLIIMLYVVCFHMLGNGINDALNPKGRDD